MPRLIKWGILSTGRIARKFALDLAGSATGRLVAVAARQKADAERFAAEHGGARAYGRYQELIEDADVEVVYIATLNPWHKAWASAAIAAGKHVLCEKPMTLCRADTAALIEEAQSRGVLLMEAFMYRCHPQTARLAALIRDGAIGELRLIRATFNYAAPYDPRGRSFSRELGGGAILDVGGYPVSFSRLLAGAADGRPFAEPVEFHAAGRRLASSGTDGYAAAVARFPGDILAEVSCGTMVLNEVAARVYGSEGWIDVPMPFFPGVSGQTHGFTLHRRSSSAPESFAFPCPAGLYAAEADALGRAVLAGEREVAAMTAADSLGNAACLDRWLEAVGVDYRGVNREC